MKLSVNTAQSTTAGNLEGGEHYVFLYATIAVFILFIIIGFAYLLRELSKGYFRKAFINDLEDSSTVCVDVTLKSEIVSPRIPDSLKQEKFEIFPCGLENKSSVCYMNSMIQAVASSDILIKEFEKINKLQKQNSHLSKFVNLLRSINESGNSKEAIYKNTKLLKEVIESVGWTKPSQQDAFDLFSSLVKEIQDGMKNIDDFEMPMKIKLVHKFNGINVPDKVQDHLGVSVGLCGNYAKRPGVTLVYLINEHFSPTIIDDDPSKTTQMFFYQQVPDVLLIHIQANKWDEKRGEMFKPTYYIKYTKEMTLPMVIVPKIGSKTIKRDEVNYELKSVVHHMGTISGGHYVTYREHHGRWYLVNDEQVSDVEFDPQIVPYILIYEKKENHLRNADDDQFYGWPGRI